MLCTEWYTNRMENRKKILQCAARLFAERGYDAVGVQEIADGAGIKKPTLYHYFGSKEGLLRTLLAESYTPLFEKLTAASEYNRDVISTLERIAGVYFDFARQNPLLYRMQLMMWFTPTGSDAFAAVGALNARQQEMMEAFFLRASQDHGNMNGRQRAYAATFLGMVNTYASLGLNGMAELDNELTHTAVHQFMHGIFS
jgi:AcrR family transcriptional regulator